MRRKHLLLDIAQLLKANPWQPVKVLSKKSRICQQNLSRLLRELEVECRLGVDPVNGRKNVKLFAIKLPPYKQQVAHVQQKQFTSH